MDVIEQVERLLGAPLASAEGLDFSVSIVEEADSWRLRLHTTERGSSEPRIREITGASCAEVSDAASVAITMAIRAAAPAAIETRPEPAMDNPSPTTAEPAAKPREDTGRVADRPPRPAVPQSPWRSTLGVFGVADFGALPNPAPGFELAAALGWRSLRAVLLGDVFVHQTEASLPADRGGEFALALGALLICGERAEAPVRPLACAGYELGSLSGEGVGVVQSRIGASTWQALRFEVGAGYAFAGAFTAMLRGGLTVPLERREFVLDGSQSIHRAASVGGRVLLGVEARL